MLRLRLKKLQIPYLILAFLFLSPFGYSKYLNFSGVYVPEVCVAPAIFLFHILSPVAFRRFVTIVFKDVWFFIVGISLIFFSLIGFVNSGSIVAVYSDLRSLMVFFVTVTIFKNLSKRELDTARSSIYAVSVVSTFLFLVFYIYFSDSQSVKALFPVFASVLALWISTDMRDNKLVFFAVILCVVSAAISSYRTHVAVAVFFTMCFVVFKPLFYGDLSLIKRIKKIVLINVVIFVAVMTLLVNFELVSSYYKSDQSRYIQAVVKWVNLYEYVSASEVHEGDDIREQYFVNLSKYWMYMLLPEGLGYKYYIDRVTPSFSPPIIYGNTLDSTWYFMSFHFGVLWSVTIVISFVVVFCKKICRQKKIYKYDMLCLLIGLFIYFSLTAVSFTHIPSAIFSGIVIGLLINNKFAGFETGTC